jgi:glyoxylase I family protein
MRYEIAFHQQEDRMNVPFQLKQIDHVVLRIKDIEASMRFYRDVLGCSIDKVQETIGLWQMRAGASLIDLVPIDGVLGKIGGAAAGLEGHNVDHFALQVTPWNEGAIRDHLGAHGIAIVDSGPRYGAEGTGPSIYILDPDGTTVELKGPPND